MNQSQLFPIYDQEQKMSNSNQFDAIAISSDIGGLTTKESVSVREPV